MANSLSRYLARRALDKANAARSSYLAQPAGHDWNIVVQMALDAKVNATARAYAAAVAPRKGAI